MIARVICHCHCAVNIFKKMNIDILTCIYMKYLIILMHMKYTYFYSFLDSILNTCNVSYVSRLLSADEQ